MRPLLFLSSSEKLNQQGRPFKFQAFEAFGLKKKKIVAEIVIG